jgi:two-component system chemotaxis sensor kinase CheA
MAIDMSQFYQVFFEEAAEHLAGMESLLLALDLDNPEAEQLNAIFRAAHSIKGSSGTFGFSDMTDVTHVMETLLDRVRKGEAVMTGDMVDACLVAGDVLKNLLAGHRGEEEADTAAAAAIVARLETLCSAIDAPPAAPAVRHCFDVRFVPDAAITPDGAKLAELICQTDSIGEVDILDQPTPGADREPWRLRVRTELAQDKLRDVIAFLAVTGSVVVTPWAADLADDEGGAFGFFGDPEPRASAADDESSSARSGWKTETEAYGFFSDIDPPAGHDVPGAELLAEESPDGAFGLFAPPAPPSADPEREDAADGAYGFFAPPAVAAPAIEERQMAAPAAAAKPAGPKAVARPAGKPAGGDSSIRVGVEKVDQLINLVGELVITQAMIQQAASEVDPVLFERLMQGLGQLERNTRDLQESVMSIRMMPISVVFTRFPRVVRDLSQKLEKKVELKTSGESTELDKGLIERITDPLTHLVRNSLDHGIESPRQRRAAGKPETGTITLKAYHQSGNIVIEVGDDGAGLNRDRILSKARERGIAAPDTMSDAEVWQLIFEPGFSTADQVTEVSGRGVGMDVVKRNIAAMGGRVDIDSMSGVGTRMTVRLPLTLAILDGMSVGVGAESYIIPLNTVVESLQPTRAMVRSISGVDRLIQVRGEYLPVVSLHELFNLPGRATEWTAGIMVILESDGTKAALFVDQLIGQHQVVIKSLEANYRRVLGLSGATIMGDGRVAMILDVAAIVQLARRAVPAAA